MHAILSATNNDLYAFPLPFTVYSWNKIGINCLVFVPKSGGEKIELAKKYCSVLNTFKTFNSPLHKEPTYSQVSRLFGCCVEFPGDEVLITGDADLCVFGDYLLKANDGGVHVFGSDLVAGDQLPMCFLAAPADKWRNIMWAPPGFGYQYYLDELLGPIESQHFRSDQWCFDQNLAYKNFIKSGLPIVMHNRAAPGTQFATRRADRDGWPQAFSPDLIDAHLPRPGYTEENFAKIINLFKSMYPNEDFQWMIDYRNEYLNLIS